MAGFFFSSNDTPKTKKHPLSECFFNICFSFVLKLRSNLTNFTSTFFTKKVAVTPSIKT